MELMTSHKTVKKYRTTFLLLLVFVVVLWFSGAVGQMLQPLLFAQFKRLEPRFSLKYHGRSGVKPAPIGATLTVSRKRIYKSAHELLGIRSWLIPPGLIPENYTIRGVTNFWLDEDLESIELPITINITSASENPHLAVTLPSDLVNEALDFEGSFTNRKKRRKYFLGHYETILWIHFDTVSLASEVPQRELRRPITFRRIEGNATGKVKFRIKENIGSVSTTAKIKKMELRCDLDFRQYSDGLAIAYNITIPALDADIKNLARIFESSPTEVLRKRLEKALSRPSKLERMSRKRFPPNLPLDLGLEIEVVPVLAAKQK